MKTLVSYFLFAVLTISANSQTVYNWTGSVNSSFGAAGNWSPVRQIGLATDILVFDNGTNISVTNVTQTTVGQIIVRNNTHVTMTVASGNPKTIFVGGSTGDDFVIEAGSSVVYDGQSTQIFVQIKAGATASISGSLTFQGEASHSIYSIDTAAIRFHSGSVLTQSCPGSIFQSTGSKNLVIFESGSELRINHNNAMPPFGLTAPESKVRFEDGSNFKVTINTANSFSLSGRSYGNIVIDNQSNLILSENITANASLGSITINQGGSLNIINRSSSASTINISGNIIANGNLHFNDTATEIKNIDLVLGGHETQKIEGDGDLNLSKLKVLKIMNTVSLYRDLTISCPVLMNGNILRNGYILIITGKYVEETVQTQLNTTNGSASNNAPKEFRLGQNYPNPFNPSTKIDYAIASDSRVSIKVYDISGREAAVLQNGNLNAGNYSVTLDATKLSSGVYFYKMIYETKNSVNEITKKMVLVK